VILVLVTLLGAVPVYAQGQAQLRWWDLFMLENLLSGWKGKLLVWFCSALPPPIS
jgi:hypothetical protein